MRESGDERIEENLEKGYEFERNLLIDITRIESKNSEMIDTKYEIKIKSKRRYRVIIIIIDYFTRVKVQSFN